MTISDAIKANLRDIAITDNELEVCQLNRGVTGADTYTGSEAQQKNVAECEHDIYLHCAAQTKFKQGSHSEEFNPATLKALAKDLAKKWGITTGTKLVSDVDGTPLW